ncbi:peptidoglycan-binding protein [Cellulomonas sp. H30R-01]|uniref:peptidoglycan-binding domain-containing protein n=1 Tax=Cellulomonas sp. H30R-01 TaxID=2704467 RepID=UPI00138D81AE|nr:peptidoglycan-binding domain-containing protein [Cellulomonas sp. H30R-01]QHT57127.1 peptidoglycan-binding protein [Cellulomonas sp. H30R-01]
MRTLTRALAVGVLAAGSLAATATASSAAVPECHYQAYPRATGYGPYITPPSADMVGLSSCWMKNGSNPVVVMRLGFQASYSAVWELQSALNLCYREPITVDGWFGAQTETALKQVQASYGLKADGIYGANTQAKLLVPGKNADGTGFTGYCYNIR